MSAESEALMQQFRQAVYERLVNSGKGFQLSPEDAIGQRSVAFRDWRIATQNANESVELAPDFVRHWAVADLTSWREMPSDMHNLAAKDIFQNLSANVSYAEILQKINAGMVDSVKSLVAENERRSAEKESRNNDAPAATPTETERTEQEAPAQAESDREKTTPVPAAPLNETAKSTGVEEADGFASGVAADADDKPFDPELVISKLLESVMYKAQKDGSVLYMVSERPAFIDHGQLNEDEEAILAAVLLAKEKYGRAFELTGSEAFQRRAIEIMLKYKVDVTLKNPQQDALRRELAKARPDASEQQEAAKTEALQPRIGKPAAEKESTAATHVSGEPGDAPEEATRGRLTADLVPVRALDWWTVQREAIHVWAKTDVELRADLDALGPQPSPDLVYWFDKAGKPCAAPSDAGAYLASVNSEAPGFADGSQSELRARVAMSSAVSRAEMLSDINLKELNMTDHESGDKGQEPKLILRGVRKLDNGEFDTTALLFKGKGDYLQGFIKVGDEKRQVIAHINERKVNQETGEIKPNFLKLSEPHGNGNGNDTSWKEIGFGNAVNRRSDGKSVYFDEVLFSVGSEVVKGRITKNVDAELHRKLGFQEPRQTRPKDDVKSDSAPGEATPKLTALAAKPKEDAASAPKARSRSRAKA